MPKKISSSVNAFPTLKELVGYMRKQKITHLEWNGAVIDLSPQAFISSTPTPIAGEAEEACTCGHPLLTEHGETGCLHGCAIDSCARPGEITQ